MADWDRSEWDGGRRNDLQPPYRHRSDSAWLLSGVLAGGVVLLLVLAGLYFAAVENKDGNGNNVRGLDELMARIGSANRVELPAARIETPEEKRAAIQAAYAADDVGVDQETLASIETLFDKLIAASREEDVATLRALTNEERYLLAAKKAGVITEMTVMEESALQLAVSNNCYPPPGWHRYLLVHVDPLPGHDEMVVYTHVSDVDGDGLEVRWWIARRGQEWKVYDWERLDFGMRESMREATCFEHSLDPRMDVYYEALSDIETAYEQIEKSEHEEAARTLRRAESRTVHPRLADDCTLRIAHAWSWLGRTREMLRASQRISDPESMPGAYYAQALAYSGFGHHARAVQFATKYEAAAGGGPDVRELKCNSLMALGRFREAVPEFEKLLKLEPDNIEALQSLGRALDDDQKHRLAVLVEQRDDPAGTAVSLAEHFSIYGDMAALDAMLGVLKRVAPGSAELEFAHGLSAAAEERYELAADHYRRAMSDTTVPEKRSQYMYRFLDAMSYVEKYLEAYEAAPDAREAFQYILSGYSEGDVMLEDDVVRQLIEAHREREPDDPWIHYYSGALLSRQEKYDEAEREFAAGMAMAEEEDRPSFRYERVFVLAESGRGFEAYEKVGPAEDTFVQLADHYRWNDETDKLARLIALHRTAHPSDERIDLYAGIVAAKREEYGEAGRLFARGYSNASEDYLKETYRSEWIDSRIEAGRPLSAYADVPPAEETFVDLARRLINQEKWDDVEKLLVLHRRQQPDDPNLLYWETEMRWQREDFPAVLDLLTPWAQAVARSRLESWESSRLDDQLLRSYVRLGRFGEAIRLAEQLYQEDGQPLRLIVAHAAAGNRDEVARYMEQYDQTNQSVDVLYSDEDVGEILRSEAYRPLRRRFPPNLPYTVGRVQLVLLLAAPGEIDFAALRAACAPVLGGDLDIAHLQPEGDDASIRNFLVHADGPRFLVTTGSGRYHTSESSEQPELKDAALAEAFDGHRGWLAITALDTSGDDDLFGPACRLAAALRGEDCLAVYFASPGRLVTNRPRLGDLLRAGGPEAAVEEEGEPAWLYRPDDGDPEETAAQREVRRGLRKFIAAFNERKPGEEFAVKVVVSTGLADEEHWISIRRIERGAYGRRTLIGEFADDSLLAPQLRAGEAVAVNTYRIADWRFTDGKATIRGRDEP